MLRRSSRQEVVGFRNFQCIFSAVRKTTSLCIMSNFIDVYLARFMGVPSRSTVLLQPTTHCLVNITEQVRNQPAPTQTPFWLVTQSSQTNVGEECVTKSCERLRRKLVRHKPFCLSCTSAVMVAGLKICLFTRKKCPGNYYFSLTYQKSCRAQIMLTFDFLLKNAM